MPCREAPTATSLFHHNTFGRRYDFCSFWWVGLNGGGGPIDDPKDINNIANSAEIEPDHRHKLAFFNSTMLLNDLTSMSDAISGVGMNTTSCHAPAQPNPTLAKPPLLPMMINVITTKDMGKSCQQLKDYWLGNLWMYLI